MNFLFLFGLGRMQPSERANVNMKSPDAPKEVEDELNALVRAGDMGGVEELLFFALEHKDVSKPKAVKIVKDGLETLARAHVDKDFTLSLYNKLIDWAEKQKRQLIKRDFEVKKAEILLEMKRYKECLELIVETAKALKKADDKLGLVKLYYLESRVYYELKNLARAKSSLVLSRSTSTLVYCPSGMQAKIDLLNGMYIADEKDYKTAYSYVIEALDGFDLSKSEDVVTCARYLIMFRVLEGKTSEAEELLKNKIVGKYVDDEGVQMLMRITEAVNRRDLKGCNDIINRHIHLVEKDAFMVEHLMHLCDTLIDSNILKVIEPYSEVGVDFIGNVLGFDEATIENRLRRMILDKRIVGSLDQETKCLVVKKAGAEKGSDKEVVEILETLSDVANSISSASQ